MFGGLVAGGLLGAAAAAAAMMTLPGTRGPVMRALRCQGRRIMRKASRIGLG